MTPAFGHFVLGVAQVEDRDVASVREKQVALVVVPMGVQTHEFVEASELDTLPSKFEVYFLRVVEVDLILPVMRDLPQLIDEMAWLAFFQFEEPQREVVGIC